MNRRSTHTRLACLATEVLHEFACIKLMHNVIKAQRFTSLLSNISEILGFNLIEINYIFEQAIVHLNFNSYYKNCCLCVCFFLSV